MSIPFPSFEFFRDLQEAMAREADCTASLPPCEAYCGFEIDQRLFVFEFDGRQCVSVVHGGNELDLDFVVTGPTSAWRSIITALEESDPGASKAKATLPTLIEQGELEIRTTDDEGPELARAALPFLQIFLEQARSLAVTHDGE